MINSLQDCTTLNNGVKMPWIGLGLNLVHPGIPMKRAIKSALDAGIRSFDSSRQYMNEKSLGETLKDIGIPREEVFITAKLTNSNQTASATFKAVEKSKKNLRVDYIDLFLVNNSSTRYDETWRTLETLYKEGQIKAIGVSNFNITHLKYLQSICEIVPAVNQVEFHPWFTQEKLLAYCQENGIQMEAWGPLARGEILDNKIIKGLAKKYGKTPAQIILRWDLQKKVVTIPKSTHSSRILENTNIFDFNLADEDILEISKLNRNKRWMWSYGS